jgi:acyl-CoA-dependent ceramide synthase
MDALFSTEWLPSYLVPFISLSYPTDTPKDADSFPNSAYYNTGRQDLCLIIICIAMMAILRDALRLGVFEPFARWKLTRDLSQRKQRLQNGQANGKANGNANGNAIAKVNGHANGNGNGHAANGISTLSPRELRQMHRSVLRFAEQGWSVVYYTFQWLFGLVCYSLPLSIIC